MRNTLILTAAALAALSTPVFAQSVTSPSQTAAPVMPAPREPTNPNANIQPMSPGFAPAPLSEGRAAAPSPAGETAPNCNVREKARSGANFS